jgi:ribosomal protein S12 methylthiotransferase
MAARKPFKTIHFVTLGCPKNRVDTEVMVGVAESKGIAIVREPEAADVVVVNTCGFIGDAKKESIETILALAQLKELSPKKRLVVAGCLSQRYANELAIEMPEVDYFMGSSDMLHLAEILDQTAPRNLVGNPADWVMAHTNPRRLSQWAHSAYVKIAEGCNRTCAFCVIPKIRGKQRSRTLDDIVAEVGRLADEGVVEANLISQDTIAYGRDLVHGVKLSELVEAIAERTKIKWIRLFYLYPEKIDDALIDLLAHHPKVLPYVDMPLQHAADSMLKIMKRGHGIDRQKRVVERLRTSIPDLTFRTAFIVGHPGESAEDFDELLAFVRWAQFERLVAFQYSDEETTLAVDMGDKVPEKTAQSRHKKLMLVAKSIARARHEALVGKELEVLVDGISDEHDLVWSARHAGQAPEIDGVVYLEGPETDSLRAGQFRRVRITQSSDYDLAGELLPLLPSERVEPKKNPKTKLRVVSE